jgi:hypothetical protein
MTTTPRTDLEQDPGAAWQDGYDLGLSHGEQMVEKPTLWLWILLGAGIVIGIELLIVFAAFLGTALLTT